MASDAERARERRLAEDSLACMTLGTRERINRLSREIAFERGKVRKLEHLWVIRHTMEPDELTRETDKLVLRPEILDQRR